MALENIIIGIILLVIGAFIIKEFPDISGYQRKEMTSAGIIFGVILALIGLVLIFVVK